MTMTGEQAARHRPFVTLAALAVAALAACSFLLTDQPLAFEAWAITSSIVLIDMIDMGVRFFLRHSARRHWPDGKALRATPRPYAIVMSVYNARQELDEVLASLQRYKNITWIIDEASTDGTFERLTRAGWHCVRGDVNRKKPGAIRALVERLPAEIATVLVLDPDVTIEGDLDRVVATFQASGAAAACPRLSIRPDGYLGDLQTMEYAISFGLGRCSLPPTGITSGIALYRRSDFAEVLDRHSLSVYAEDLENSFHLLAAGKSVLYTDTLIVETEGKRNLADWFSQRVGWAFGFLKVYAERLPEMRRIALRSPVAFYQFVIYFGLFSIALLPLKLVSLTLILASALNGIDLLAGAALIPDTSLTNPANFSAAYLKYTLMLLIAGWATSRSSEAPRIAFSVPLYFFYSVGLVIPTTLGYLNWIWLRIFGTRLYADHYDAAPKLMRETGHA